MFHDTQAEFGDRGDGYVSRTIALVNCCPSLRYSNNSASSSHSLCWNVCSWLGVYLCVIGLSCRSLVERCRQCDPQGSEESAQRANSSLDRIINHSVRVLTERLFEHIRVNNSTQDALKSCFSSTVFENTVHC